MTRRSIDLGFSPQMFQSGILNSLRSTVLHSYLLVDNDDEKLNNRRKWGYPHVK